MILPRKGQLVLFDDCAPAALEDIWHEKEMPSKEQDHVDVILQSFRDNLRFINKELDT